VVIVRRSGADVRTKLQFCKLGALRSVHGRGADRGARGRSRTGNNPMPLARMSARIS
jgi:hypothetical protein